MLTSRYAVFKTTFYGLLLFIFLFTLLKYTGINPLKRLDALQVFWGTLLSETYNFYKTIPVLTIAFLLWIRAPRPIYLFMHLNTIQKITNYYYRQLVAFLIVIAFSWTLVLLILSQMLIINPENISFSLILSGTYILNLAAFLSTLLLFLINLSETWGAFIITVLLYIDQWLYLHTGQSILFYHGLISSTLATGINLSTVISDTIWNSIIIVICYFLNKTFLKIFKPFTL